MLSKNLLVRISRAREALSLQGEACPIAEVASGVGMSESHFIRRFKATFGETPHRFRTRMRLEHAKWLLAATDIPVTEVCALVGFSSLGSFSALFLRRTGQSPSAFRHHFRTVEDERTVDERLVPGCIPIMNAARGK